MELLNRETCVTGKRSLAEPRHFSPRPLEGEGPGGEGARAPRQAQGKAANAVAICSVPNH